MKRWVYAFYGLTVATALVGCGENGVVGDSSGKKPVTLSQTDLQTLDEIKSSIALDSNLSTEEKYALANDWRRMKTLIPNSASSSYSNSGYPKFGTAVDNAYATLFGSKTSTVLNFIKTRTKFFISVDSNAGFGRPSKETVAVNYSIIYWIDGMLSGNPANPPNLSLLGQSLPRTSSRVGTVQFGAALSESEDSLFRIGTLAHEARHSDCPNGISAAQLNQIDNDPGNFFNYVGTCAFPHAKCPTGHPLAGINACDQGDGWGAYSVEVAFFGRIFHQCATSQISCSESEIQQALAGLNDGLNRIIKIDDMMDNAIGLPNMSHQGYTN